MPATSVRAQKATDTTVTQQGTRLLRLRCMTCHNASVRSGGVDLSSREAASKTGALPASPATTSKIVQQISAGKMPPTGKLPADEIKLLSAWIASGAVYPTTDSAAPAQTPLWSLQPVTHPTPPKTPFDSLAANPIDRFLFAKLAAKGLKPSPPADRRTLLKRVSIDLTGLPSTPAEIDAFVNDRAPNAYEKVVDRLLASPAYGERWGRHWLDVVRYGESTGYEQNHIRPNAWHYRDYVIRALNEDRSYTRFITEQLAADAVAPNDPDTLAATGFLVAGIHDTVGIQTDEGTRQQRANDLDDMVATTGAAFLGLSVGCARCHDHKFDPIPQKDYYRLTACLAGVRHGERALPTAQQDPQTPDKLKALKDKSFRYTNEISALEDGARQRVLASRGATPGTRPAVNSRRNVDEFAPTEARFVRFTILATTDGAEPCLDELQVFGPEASQNLALATTGAKATASSLLPGYAVHQIGHLNDGLFGNEHSWVSSQRGTGWAQIELPAVAKVQRLVWSRDAGVIPRFDDRIPSRYRIEVSLDGKQWRTVSTEEGRKGSSDYIHPDELVKAMTADERARHAELLTQRTTTDREIAHLTSQQMAYIGQFTQPDPIFLLKRGDVMQRLDPMAPGALSCIATLPAELDLPNDAPEPQRRLALARWIADPRNPLTPRVMVNRIWQYHFGRGIVSTPSDFGRNGDRPSHPELLDWLVTAFAKDDYRLKPLHRQIVLSYTYRQSPDISTEANGGGSKGINGGKNRGMDVDAGNQLLWRMPLRRMEAEAIRDSILQASGKLNRTMGGPSYMLFKYRVVNVAIYEPQENYGPETWRRSVYQTPARGIHDELLSAFDCPESSQRAPHRDATTTALQALNLLNGPFLQQQSGFLAERVRTAAGDSVGSCASHPVRRRSP